MTASCKVTKVAVRNESVNIIPDFAEFAIDLRAQTNAAMDAMLLQVEKAVYSAGGGNGSEVTLKAGAGMMAAVPNLYLEQIVGQAIEEILPVAGRVPPPVTLGAEDFHFYPLLRPEVQATMVGLGTNLTPGLHHPQMQFDLSALRTGAAVLALSAIKLFETGVDSDTY